MSPELLALAVVVGAATYAFRYGPTRMNLSAISGGGRLSRALAAIGPAAIATLVAASLLPFLQPSAPAVPLVAGTGAVLGIWLATRSVVAATLAGSLAYGLVAAL